MRPVGSEVAAHFPYGAHSAQAARRLVPSTLGAWGRTELEEVATLLVSELVANVVLHAGTGLDLHIGRAGERVRIEVHDGSGRLPARKHHAATATTGRGLLLVDRLDAAWGAVPTPTGKAVWFELDETAVAGAACDLEDWPDLSDEGDPCTGRRRGPPDRRIAGARDARPSAACGPGARGGRLR